jgi:N-acetyl-anhydromuramyl-L-alanine amidase AmpD
MTRTLSWIPWAIKHPTQMRTRGTYSGGYPKGAVVHYTAGRFEGGLKKAHSTIEGGIKNGYAYLCIAHTGELVQAHPIEQWGYHAGESKWKGLFGAVSDDLIGIEMNCAGLLTEKKGQLLTWWGDEIPRDDARFVKEKDYGCPTGWYHKYTPAQEETLIKTLLWLKMNDPLNNFSFDYVLGHSEVSGVKGLGWFRKQDPGGSLSMPMDQFRELLKSQYAATQAQAERLP